ncbi:hypothetical protein PanWU01x14_255300 [Parasponia andersonii]|uniref:Uncharacterized protein n=1 Tax=Parasponia andersonii TaxID=3476 RepID=A0A2P5BAW2_PARAD|nr:hypothetical protein PanWU01x14_255300 [Parasponia andersonii]
MATPPPHVNTVKVNFDIHLDNYNNQGHYIVKVIALRKLYRRVCRCTDYTTRPQIFRDGIKELIEESKPQGLTSSSIGSETDLDLNL